MIMLNNYKDPFWNNQDSFNVGIIVITNAKISLNNQYFNGTEGRPFLFFPVGFSRQLTTGKHGSTMRTTNKKSLKKTSCFMESIGGLKVSLGCSFVLDVGCFFLNLFLPW